MKTKLYERLLLARRRCNLTQKEASQLTGIHRTTIEDIENGRGGFVNDQYLSSFAKAYRIDIKELRDD